MIIPIIAKLVETGDILTDREGRYTRMVTDVDLFSNVHGMIIIRSGTASVVTDPESVLHIKL